ncbi:LysE family transporter [Aquamicrobium sp. LC103]|uniref:LysE family translocator n=1 Tax=Aquamicrobium sp. LC103 TaxID=1120658 RepID=UPI00069A4261|nr:LysE family transporter [Aquamicrobium sp. LC103]TKT75780.1 hypothetical protein XW59_018210 [Aquamicrobium sp. LC103]
MENWLAFSAAAIALLFVPGPTNTLIATNGALLGWRMASRFLPAEVTGYLVGITGWALGLAIASRYVHSASSVAAIAASAALLFSARKLWTWNAGRQTRVSSRARDVFVVTLSNPKALLFALTIMPHLRQGDFFAALPYLLWLSLLILAMGFIWTMIGAGIAQRFQRFASSHLFARVGAAVLVFFATSLFVTTLLRAFEL